MKEWNRPRDDLECDDLKVGDGGVVGGGGGRVIGCGWVEGVWGEGYRVWLGGGGVGGGL